MRRLLVVILALSIVLLSACSQQKKLGSAERSIMSDAEREEFLASLERGEDYEYPIFEEDGIIINSDGYLEVSTWKLNALSDAYFGQSDMEYIVESYNLEDDVYEDYWMAHDVTTQDFECVVLLYGDEDSMTLEIQLKNPELPYIVAPRGCILNGVLRNTELFRMSEPEKGRFLISANMADVTALDMFGLTQDNISSIAWLLTAINTDTQELRDFLLASQFPVTEIWEGIRVSEVYAAGSGIIMWVLRNGDTSYLCVFNGSETRITSDITITGDGSMIHTNFSLDVLSGECLYQVIGYNTSNVEVFMGDTLLFSEIEEKK